MTDHQTDKDRVARLRGSGILPRLARKPTLLDEWDVVRAAQHMVEVHGRKAVATAVHRAETARDLDLARRWRAIAAAIRDIADPARPPGRTARADDR